MTLHRTTEELEDLFAQGFVDFRAKYAGHRTRANDPAYKLGAEVARVNTKTAPLDAMNMFKLFLDAKLDLPKDTATDQNGETSAQR